MNCRNLITDFLILKRKEFNAKEISCKCFNLMTKN